MKRSKYGNKRVLYNDVWYDSQKELDRFKYLSSLEESGVIKNLVYHNTYELIPKITHDEVVTLKTKTKTITKTDQFATTYESDFEYDIVENDQHIVEDVKPSPKMIPADFKLKAKLLFWRYGIKVKLVFKANEEIKN